MTWANGESEILDKSTIVGPIEFLVSEQVTQPLLATNDLVNANNKVVFDSERSYIENKTTGLQTDMQRTDGLWTINIDTLEGLQNPAEDPTTTIAEDDDFTYTANHGASRKSKSLPREIVWDLHRRFGHCSCEVMCSAVGDEDNADPTWRNSGVTASQIRRVFRKERCLDCILAKRNLDPPSTNEQKQYAPGECISADPSGSISPAGPRGEKIFFLFKDVGTGYLHAIPSKTNDSESFLEALKQVVKFYKRYGHKPRILRTDHGNELKTAAVDDFLVSEKMSPQHSAPYRHFQNSVERDMQTVVKGTATLLHAQPWLRSDRWTDALLHFVDCRNRVPNAHTGYKSPHHVITGDHTDLRRTYQFAFGDLVSVGIPEDFRSWKFDVKNDIAIYVGQEPGTVDTHRVYRPYQHDVVLRGSVNKLEITDLQFLRWFGRRMTMKERPLPYNEFEDAVIHFNDQVSPITPDAILHGDPLTYPSRNTNIPSSDRILRSHISHFSCLNPIQTSFAATRGDDNPTVNQALRSQWADHWRKAIIAEIKLLFDGGTFEPISLEEILALPRYKRIYTTMQLKRKIRSQDGNTDKFKARCCARGDLLKGLITDTYSPTVNSLTFSVVHQLAIMNDMHRKTIDVVGAYLYQDYPDDAIPLIVTLEPAVAIACGLDPKQSYRIRKYLYGLPDAGKAYYKAYSSHLIANGYQRSTADPCLFVRVTDSETTYVVIHVDDTFIASSNKHGLTRFEEVLKSKFEITSNENADSYLGIHLESLSDGSVKLTQPKQLQSIFKEFPERHNSSRASSPFPPSYSATLGDNSTPIDTKFYLHLLGALLYVTHSRPDIMTAVSYAATKSSSPTQSDFDNLLHIVDYLRNTPDRGHILMKHPSEPLSLYCYVDAAFLPHSDSKSHTGYYLSFGTVGSFYCKSSKQTLVATSSTHAEAKALYSLITDVMYVVQLCKDLKQPLHSPATIYEDNLSVIQLCDDAHLKKSKHYLMTINYLKEAVELGAIKLIHVDTNLNPADALSKPLSGPPFIYKTKQFMGYEPDEAHLPPPLPKRRKFFTREN